MCGFLLEDQVRQALSKLLATVHIHDFLIVFQNINIYIINSANKQK